MIRLIRTLDFAEIGTLLDWAAAEGWNPGLSDASAFQAADPSGFFGAFIDSTMVAGISAVAYGADFGFIGLYICHPAWRGHGHGKAVWDAAMAYLGDRTIGLDGVAEQQANYARMGFSPAYETFRMSGTLPATGAPAPPVVPLGDIVAFDRQCFPAARDQFLRHWIAQPNRLVSLSRDGAIEAYAVLRPCRDGAKIGPLFAGTGHSAVELLTGLAGSVHIDVPAFQSEWLEELVTRGFTQGFRTLRMYRGAPPLIDLTRVFGVSSLELG